MPLPTVEHVAWVDVMGTQAAMARSISRTANFIFKLHIAALQSPHAGVSLYPVMDGLYAACPSQPDMFEFLRGIFQDVADEFNQATDPPYRFIIRRGLAFGPAVHGRNVLPLASATLAQNSGYRDSVLLGLPMVQAHLSESSAPPFGIYVHESARSFAPAEQPHLHYVWWRWSNGPNQSIWNTLAQKLPQHLEWCAQRALPLGYARDRIEVHREMVNQYFMP